MSSSLPDNFRKLLLPGRGHKNVRLPEVIVSNTLVLDHLPIVFHLLAYIRTSIFLYPVEKITDWARFQSLASELISLRSQINSKGEDSKAAQDFTASIALVYSLWTRKIALSDVNKGILGLERLLKHKRRLRKLASNLGSSM
jgi:hypothetical protein